jgi:hypothetical protein
VRLSVLDEIGDQTLIFSPSDTLPTKIAHGTDSTVQRFALLRDLHNDVIQQCISLVLRKRRLVQPESIVHFHGGALVKISEMHHAMT